MRTMDKLKLRIRSLFHRDSVERELSAELRFHVEREADENIAKGMSPEEARLAAIRSVGTVAQFAEECRDARGLNFFESLAADVRYALRTLRKAPVFAAVAVLSLALGTGANTAIFSLIDSVLLQKLPVRNPEQLVYVRTSTVKMGNFQVSRTLTVQSLEYLTRATQLEGIATYRQMDRANVAIGKASDVASAVFVSGNYFTLLGVDPALGRNLGSADAQGGTSGWPAMIGYGFWQRRLGGSTDVLGQQVTINSIPMTIVGVMPRRFRGLFIDSSDDVVLPFAAFPQVSDGQISAKVPKPDDYAGQLVARFKPGVTMESAQSELTVLFHQSLVADKGSITGDDSKLSIVLTSAASGSSALRNRFEKGLQVLMAVVAIVMLIASANLASLLLTRSAVRQREICIRMSLGSSRSRLVRQLLTEALVLSVIGSVLGLLFAVWARNAIVKVAVAHASGVTPFPMDWSWHVFAFTVSLCVLNALLFGAVPALKATRQNANLVLHSGRSMRATGVIRLGKILVAGQVALSLALVVGAALLLRTLANFYRVDLGYNHKNVLLLTVDPHLAGYADGEQSIAIYKEIRERLAGVPGVQSVSMMREPLLGSNVGMSSVYVPGYVPAQQEGTSIRWSINEGVGPHFFATMQMPLVAGRDFDDETRDSYGKVAIINETMAKHYFAGKDAVGQRFGVEKNGATMEIIGVAADAHYHGAKEEPEDVFFVPLLHPDMKQKAATLLLRTFGDPQLVAPEARAAIHSLSPNLPVYGITTMDEMLDANLAQQRILGALSGFFGLLALVLSAIGLYGVLAYNVTQRTGEIGVRMALGADRTNILRLIFGETVIVVGAGIVAGLVITLTAAKLIRTVLYGVNATDAQSIALAVLVLGVVALAAAFIPMRKAMRVDPMTALREE